MALRIYQGSSPLSEGADFSNPLVISGDASRGFTQVFTLAVGSEDSTAYTDVAVEIVDDSASQFSDNASGCSWKLSTSASPNWNDVEAGAALSLQDIPNSTTRRTFYLQVEVPARLSPFTTTEVSLRAVGTAS